MVQGYTQANTPNPSEWCSSFGSQGGKSWGTTIHQRISPYNCNHQHEQRCVCQTEELKLRESFEIRRETGGLMLTMMGLSILKYFKNLFAAIAAGRTDYERSALPLVPVRVSRICCL